jgi:hypothetical protein
VLGLDDGRLELWEAPRDRDEYGHLHPHNQDGGGRQQHLGTTKRVLQSLQAHKAPLTALSVKTATPRTRLVLSAAEDCSMLISTFDGQRLQVGSKDVEGVICSATRLSSVVTRGALVS